VAVSGEGPEGEETWAFAPAQNAEHDAADTKAVIIHRFTLSHLLSQNLPDGTPLLL
jgi:hypothetical protein